MKFLIKPINDEIKQMYTTHSTYHKSDSGLDLFIVKDQIIPAGKTVIVDLGISCQLISTDNIMDSLIPYFSLEFFKDITEIYRKHIYKEKYYSYNMYSRSSISKTPLMLANGVSLCDAGCLGSLKAPFHNTSQIDYIIKKGERYVQLARHDLGAIDFEVVESLRTTDRGESGFGSTGK